MLVKSQVKYIQSLGQKKYRDEAGIFIAEGPKLVSELLVDIPSQVQEVYATSQWIELHQNLVLPSLVEITEAELEKISQLNTPNQVLALVRKFIPPLALEMSNQILLALDTIQDPGNLGTIIRIADWFGIKQLVCSHECADIYNPKVVQASMGSIARVKMIHTDLRAWLSSEDNIKIYAAVLEGTDIRKMEKLAEGVILVGNESKGIREDLLKFANVRITIPRVGRAESLNAAVATGIILSHLV
ncbi:MAG TPA: RNA methyltransferase [Chitinophagaceae bacterium]|nr:RNA methyltransferase [Chitinophagaceae bacterium]